jgi:hypothetical protein
VRPGTTVRETYDDVCSFACFLRGGGFFFTTGFFGLGVLAGVVELSRY